MHGQRIDGVVTRSLEGSVDERGVFTELFQQSWDLPVRPVQWSVVESKPRVLRGLHLHWRHDELLVLVSGRALLGLQDVRHGSPTFGVWSLFELDAVSRLAVSWPRGVLHGWYFSESAVHLQAVSEPYADYRRDDNHVVHWADPDVRIPWPDPDPVLSARSREAGSLRRIIGPATTYEAVAPIGGARGGARP